MFFQQQYQLRMSCITVTVIDVLYILILQLFPVVDIQCYCGSRLFLYPLVSTIDEPKHHELKGGLVFYTQSNVTTSPRMSNHPITDDMFYSIKANHFFQQHNILFPISSTQLFLMDVGTNCWYVIYTIILTDGMAINQILKSTHLENHNMRGLSVLAIAYSNGKRGIQ